MQAESSERSARGVVSKQQAGWGFPVACSGTLFFRRSGGGWVRQNDDEHGKDERALETERGRAWGHGGVVEGMQREGKNGKCENPDHTVWAERSDRRLFLQILLPNRKPKAQDS